MSTLTRRRSGLYVPRVTGGPVGTDAYSIEVLADSPLAYWRLDETSGSSPADTSGNGHVGTYAGASLSQPPLIGNSGTSVLFNNTTIDAPQASWMEVSTFSVEVLIKPTNATHDNVIAARDDLGAVLVVGHGR